MPPPENTAMGRMGDSNRPPDWPEAANWPDEDGVTKGFVPAFMEVYGDIIKGMTPHETGSLASMIYLKMR